MAYCRGRTPCLLGNYELIHQWETKDMLQQLWKSTVSTSISSQTWSKIRVFRWFSHGQRNSFPQTWITGFRIRLGLDPFIFGAEKMGDFDIRGMGRPRIYIGNLEQDLEDSYEAWLCNQGAEQEPASNKNLQINRWSTCIPVRIISVFFRKDSIHVYPRVYRAYIVVCIFIYQGIYKLHITHAPHLYMHVIYTSHVNMW